METKAFDVTKLADPEYFAEGRLAAHSDHAYFASLEEAEGCRACAARRLEGGSAALYGLRENRTQIF